MDPTPPKKKRGRPVILVTCPICHKQKPTKEFNRLKTACKGCQVCFTSYLRPGKARLGRPPKQTVMTADEFEPILASIKAQEAMDRGWAEFKATFPPEFERCHCCKTRPNIGEIPGIEPYVVLCGVCWWDVQHCGQCQQCKGHAADPDPPIYYPHLTGRPIPPMPIEMKREWGLIPPEPGPPLTPEQIAADCEGD